MIITWDFYSLGHRIIIIIITIMIIIIIINHSAVPPENIFLIKKNIIIIIKIIKMFICNPRRFIPLYVYVLYMLEWTTVVKRRAYLNASVDVKLLQLFRLRENNGIFLFRLFCY